MEYRGKGPCHLPVSLPWLNRIVAVLSVSGLAVSVYLVAAHLGILPLSCAGTGSACQVVATHPISHGFGIPFLSAIPTAAFGIPFFLFHAMLAIGRPRLRSFAWLRRVWITRLTVTGMAVGLLLFLAGVEQFVIQRWCVWCVITAIITLFLFALTYLDRPTQSESGAKFCKWECALIAAIEILVFATLIVFVFVVKADIPEAIYLVYTGHGEVQWYRGIGQSWCRFIPS